MAGVSTGKPEGLGLKAAVGLVLGGVAFGVELLDGLGEAAGLKVGVSVGIGLEVGPGDGDPPADGDGLAACRFLLKVTEISLVSYIKVSLGLTALMVTLAVLCPSGTEFGWTARTKFMVLPI
jgi:hypothetical protein